MKPIVLLTFLLLAGQATAQSPDPNFPQINQGSSVEALTASGDMLYVAGQFTMLGSSYRQNIAALDILTGAILPWAPQVNGTVRGMLLRNGLLYLWGAFTQVNGQPRNNLAVVNAITGELHPFNPNITFPGIPGMQTGTISAVDLIGDTVYLAGYFIAVNLQSRNNLAALTLNGDLLNWSPATNIPVERILATEQSVYIAGPFTQPLPGLLAFDRHTGDLLPWSPAPNNPGNTMGPITVAYGNTDIFVSGRFSHLKGNAHPFIARVDNQSGQPTSFNPGINFTSPGQVSVRTFSQLEGNLYIGGNFNTQFHSNQRLNLVVLDAVSGMLKSWNPAPNGQVNAILHHKDALFIGGAFTQISGQPHKKLAAYNTATISHTDPTHTSPLPFLIFPNPASEKVWFQTSRHLVSLHLLDPLGRVSSAHGTICRKESWN